MLKLTEQALYWLKYFNTQYQEGEHIAQYDVAEFAESVGYPQTEFGDWNYPNYEKVMLNIEKQILEESKVISRVQCGKGGSEVITYRHGRNDYMVYRVWANGWKFCIDAWREK
jgi:hypothetical protein